MSEGRKSLFADSIEIDGRRYYSEAKIIDVLAGIYQRHGVLVACICDQDLDPSGRLLGYVRDAVIDGTHD